MKTLLVTFVGVTAFAVHAQVLFTYTFPGADPAGDASAPTADHLTISPFARANVSAASQNDAFTSSRWTQTSTQDPAEYVSFSFRPDTGYELAVTSLHWDTSRSSTGPQIGRVELFRNGLSLSTSPTFAVGTTSVPQSFDFSPASGTASDLFEFRFYGWQASGTGNLRLDNVAVAGAVTPIPEPPASGLVLATGLIGFAVRLFRRNRQPAAPQTA